jgi:hypothetical protein
MTGNVTATLKAGTLTIKGDRHDNSVTIFENAKTKMLVVSNYGGTVNGRKSFQFRDKAITKDVKVNMAQGGDDTFVVGGSPATSGGIYFPRDFLVSMGPGNNRVGISQVYVIRDMIIKLDKGDDLVTLDTTGADNISVETGEGNDQVYLFAVSALGFSARNVNVDLGEGDDGLELAGAFLIDNVTADGGPGDYDSLSTSYATGQFPLTQSGFETVMTSNP